MTLWFINIEIRVILWYPSKKKKGVQYPLVGNLLHQITFFSHLTVLSSHCVILISHVIVLFSHLVVPLFFFPQIWRFHPPIVRSQHHKWQFFCHIEWFLYFFLTLDSSILILCSSNITCDSFFLTFGSSFTFFSHLMVLSSHCTVLISHVTVLFSNLVVLLFFSHIWRFHYHIV